MRAALRGGRLGHCYLLCGPRGRCEELAREVAAAYLCPTRGSDRPDPALACGRCPACRALGGDTHPDLRRWEAERGTWRIEQVRALIAEAFRRPSLGERRVHILADVHLLSLPSANALLKLLEDPPPGTLFLLLAEQVTDLPPTLLSRCQVLTWPREEPAPGEGVATGQPGPSPAEEVLEAVAGGKGSQLLLLARRLAESGDQVVDHLAVLIRERVARMVTTGDQSAAVPWLRAWEAVDRAASRLEANGNPRLVWECLLLELAEVLGAAR